MTAGDQIGGVVGAAGRVRSQVIDREFCIILDAGPAISARQTVTEIAGESLSDESSSCPGLVRRCACADQPLWLRAGVGNPEGETEAGVPALNVPEECRGAG